MKKTLLLGALFLMFFNGSGNLFTTQGYKPVYVPKDEAKIIRMLAPQEMITQGKIYIKDNFIYVGDINLGVHIIDNSNPESPKKVGFLQIYGNHDIAIKGNMLYADNLEDLVVINIEESANPQIVKRIEDVYTLPNQFYPENLPYHTYFECADPEKGYVVGWIPATLENPDCWTSY